MPGPPSRLVQELHADNEVPSIERFVRLRVAVRGQGHVPKPRLTGHGLKGLHQQQVL